MRVPTPALVKYTSVREQKTVEATITMINDNSCLILNKDVKNNCTSEPSQPSNLCDVFLSYSAEVAVTTIQLGGLDAKACVDTGAGRCYLSRHMLEKILRHNNTCVSLEAVSVPVRMADAKLWPESHSSWIRDRLPWNSTCSTH